MFATLSNKIILLVIEVIANCLVFEFVKDLIRYFENWICYLSAIELLNVDMNKLSRKSTCIQCNIKIFLCFLYLPWFSGDKIAINEWLDIACESAVIVEIEKKDSIFRWLRTFLLKARSCAHLAVQRISSFISDCCYPSEAYYEAVKEYVQLGPNLSVNTLFRALIRSARCQLNSQASILRYSNVLF